MKHTGVVRHIDQLGRIVIPREMRRVLKINTGDGLEITMEGKRIFMQKHEESCTFCGGDDHLKTFEGKRVCQRCLSHLAQL